MTDQIRAEPPKGYTMTIEPDATNIPELILKRINDLRNDNKFTREAILTFGRQIVQFPDRLGGIENAIADMRKDITGVRTDIVLLENKNLELMRIESRLDEQELHRKAFWKAANNIGPMLFFSVALGVMLAWRKINAGVDRSKTPNGRYGYRSQLS